MVSPSPFRARESVYARCSGFRRDTSLKIGVDVSSITSSAIRVETPADLAKMPTAYQELLRHQMLVHTEGELSGADDYLQVFLPLAPNVFERKICCERAAEEYDHYLIGAAVLRELGVDTEYMVAQRLEDRSLYASPAIHRITSWAQRGVFSFLGEDAVLDHIKEMAHSSYVPWASSFLDHDHWEVPLGLVLIRRLPEHQRRSSRARRSAGQREPDAPRLQRLGGRPPDRRVLLHLGPMRRVPRQSGGAQLAARERPKFL